MEVLIMETMLQRAEDAGLQFDKASADAYLKAKDNIGPVEKDSEIPEGYKRCGKCGEALKFYLFNKNKDSKTNTSGSCKECQKQTAQKSYKKTKNSRNHKKYYQENKEAKQAAARKYYQENKEELTAKHKAYVSSKKGKKVMARAHAKRHKSLAENAGIPYTREQIIRRDGEFAGHGAPICYLCTKPIEDISGKSLHLDHVVPVVQGGLDCFTNIASTHANCNLTREKDARELKADQVDGILALAERYIDAHPTEFEE
jgi:5-methylcytosine-specific restriction endonuclease McrA